MPDYADNAEPIALYVHVSEQRQPADTSLISRSQYLSASTIVERHRKWSAGPGSTIVEKNAAEKQAVDDAIKVATRDADRADAAGVPESDTAFGMQQRAIFDTLNEGNLRQDRRLLEELVATMTSIKAAAGGPGTPSERLDAIAAAIPDERSRQSTDNPLATPAEFRYVGQHPTSNEQMRAYRDNVEAGNVDDPPDLDEHEVPDAVKGNGAKATGGR